MQTKILIFAAAMMIALANAAPTYSQDYVNTPVTISKEKVKIGGKLYYSHIVLEKQTLYSISKAYDVSTDELYGCNPTLKENGLKKNSIILIPVKSETPKQKSTNTGERSEDKTPANQRNLFPSQAKAKDESSEPGGMTEKNTGATGIKEGVTPEVSKTDNARRSVSKEEDEKDDEEQGKKSRGRKKTKVHTVKWYEDLDTIAEKYDIPVTAIMAANNLTGRKLSNRQKLVIPDKEEIKNLEIKTDDKASEEVNLNITENQTIQTQQTDTPADGYTYKNIFRKNRTDVALLLPLKADGVSSSRHNMDFYSGALLAIRELGEEGMNINLNVYDIADPNVQIKRETLESNDVVIGPVSTGNIANILDIAAGCCQIVSPLDPRAEKLAAMNWNLIQTPTPHSVLYREMMRWINEEKSEDDSIIFITEKGAQQTGTYLAMKSAADSAGLSYRTFSYSILEGRDVLEPLKSIMTEHAGNRFIVASESEAFVNDVVRNLNLLIHNKYSVTLYAPAKIRNFETMEVENLHNTNLHLCLGYDIDYEDIKVRNFLLKFRALYNTEPSQFAFQGYDIMKYYIKQCNRYGKNWSESLGSSNAEMLQSSFRFRRIENGGWINEGVRKVVYEKDWIVRRL